MEIKLSDGTERFDNTEFSNEISDGKSTPLFSTYTCPACGEKTGFTKKNFEERAWLKFSNLSEEHSEMFNKYVTEKEWARLNYLDWYCPGCELPVRVYVENWAGGRHGDAGVDIKYVLELS